MNILVIDHEPAGRQQIRAALGQQAGHVIWEAGDAGAARALLVRQQFDLVLLEVMVSQEAGWDLCRQLRSACDMPIIVVSARGQVDDRVRGLQAGADDYLPKPFHPAELAARAGALLRRARRHVSPNGQDCLRVGDLVLDLGQQTVTLKGRKPVKLTPTEFRLLLTLARSSGRPCSRGQLLESIWGQSDGAGRSTINAYVTELRRKLEPTPHHPRYIVTVREAGYRLDC